MNQTVSYFDVLFLRCGVIGHILWALSVITGVLIVRQLLAVRPKILLPGGLTNQLAGLVGGGQVNQAMELAGRDDSLLGYMVHAALMESPMGYQAMERAMEEALDQQTASLLRKLEWLNVVGNIGPMLGLMGTVWGMIMAFVAIWETGGIPDPSNLAGAIGIALVTTLVGLGIAIPALSVYAILRNRLDELSNKALVFCQELILQADAGGETSLPTNPPDGQCDEIIHTEQKAC